MPAIPRIEILQRLICLLAIPTLACFIYYSARLAVADAYYRENTPESLARAVQADAGNAAYHQLYAEHLESLGHDPLPEREKAALLSPLDSKYWIDLGTLAEVRGDYSSAERYYLKAATVDRKFNPRWALMNYYLRRHEEGPFWEWARKAMDMAYGDVSQVFRLCWLMTDDAEKIRRAIPESDYMRTEYLNFLIGQGHLDVAAPVARAVAVRATARDLGPLLAYCGNAMTKDAGSAVVVWNLLSRRGLEPFGALDPGSGSILTNGEFLTAPVAAGFDWHFSAADGVSVTMAGGDGVAVELTGEQAQAVNVMNEWIPLDKDGTYRIQFRYSSGEDGPMARSQASGLTWEVENPLGGAVLARSSDLKTGVSGVTDHFDFSAAGASVAVLSLRYERVPGTVRRQEKFTIQRVASQRLGAPLRP